MERYEFLQFFLFRFAARFNDEVTDVIPGIEDEAERLAEMAEEVHDRMPSMKVLRTAAIAAWETRLMDEPGFSLHPLMDYPPPPEGLPPV